MVDTSAWGAGGRKTVQVRVLLPAPRASGKCQERISKPAAEMSLARSLEIKRSTGPTVEMSRVVRIKWGTLGTLPCNLSWYSTIYK